MLETLLKPNTGASLSGCVRWTQPMDGVRVCDFDCALTVPPVLPAEPSEVPCEVLFCRQGGLRLTMTDGRQVFLQEHEVLLLLGASVKSLSVADGLFGGELVLIEVLLGEDNRLPLAVRGSDLLHRKCLANCVVDMAFAHAAHHAVNAESNFQHGCNAPFVPEPVSFY